MYLLSVYAQLRAFLGRFVKNKRGLLAIEYAIMVSGMAAITYYIFGTDGSVRILLSSTFLTIQQTLSGVIGY